MTPTRRCPGCGAEYAEWVERCPDCLVALVADGAAGPEGPADDQLVYELGGWTEAQRSHLVRLLERHGVSFAWEATDLVVHAGDEAVVDAQLRIVDPEVEAVEHGAEEPIRAGPGGAEGLELVYDLDALDDEQRGALGAALVEAGVPHDWEGATTLVVPVTHEETVERVLDGVEFPEALPVHDDDGEDDTRAHDVLSELFLASDRLQHDGADREGADGLLAAIEHGAGLSAPFGVDPAVWDQARQLAGAMEDAIRVEHDESVEDQARALRALLRPLI